MTENKTPPFILASQSQSRRKLLENAGVPFVARASNVDEAPLKETARRNGVNIVETALLLAQAKAEDVSAASPGALVLGADQMLECEGRRFDKAKNIEEAKEQLRFLSGKTHRLVTALVMAVDGQKVWQYVEEARLTVRAFSEEFLENYAAALGPEITAGVGGYALEGKGAQLIERLVGDYFGILGLPLMPLLSELRRRKVLPA